MPFEIDKDKIGREEKYMAMPITLAELDEKMVVQEIIAQLEAELYYPNFKAQFRAIVERNAFVPQVIFAVAQATNATHNFQAVQSFAKAMHLFGVASRLFDDLIDDDKDNSVAARLGLGRAISLALANWTVAERYLTELGGAEKFIADLHIIFLRALEIQYEELETVGQELSIQQNIERAALKTGLYMQSVFEIASWLAGGAQEQMYKYRAVGYRLGIMDQLYNDAKDCFEPNPRRNTLRAGQFCLPLSYALRNESIAAEQIRQLWQRQKNNPNQSQVKLNCEAKIESASDENHRELLILLGKCGAFVCTELTLHQIYLEITALLDEQKKGENFLLQVARNYLRPLNRATKTAVSKEKREEN
jgi:geranylgeranyl pyrophosphate synthase